MPLYIVKNDITKIECDAIVNAANNELRGGGGVDGAIHKAAGKELLRECITLGGCETGDAKITKGYNLPCKYVIHTVGPVWRGGEYGEERLLKSCYEKSLELAKKYGCETVAFPLISSGIYGYPKDKALTVAVEKISEFLLNNEMTVYIVVLDKQSYQISNDLYNDVSDYIGLSPIEEVYSHCDDTLYLEEQYLRVTNNHIEHVGHFAPPSTCQKAKKPKEKLSIKDVIVLCDSFTVTLLKLIDKKGMTDVECYKKANVSKQTWYKIMNEKNYKPSKNTVISFAIALKLSLEETNMLLSTVGFALSKSLLFDVIIEYFLVKKEYNIFTINETLFQFDQECLGI